MAAGHLAKHGAAAGQPIYEEMTAILKSDKDGYTRALAAYARLRDQLQPSRKATSFFVSIIGTRLLYADILITFRQLTDAAGIGAQSSVCTHIHDLRHSFAVHTLVDWYRNGEDVQARLPALATYLGHVEPRSTYWYLSGAPELLGLAAGRLETFVEARP